MSATPLTARCARLPGIRERNSPAKSASPNSIREFDAEELESEGLLEQIQARHHDGRVDISVDDQRRPILLAVSDNGPQMTSGSTGEFMALRAIARHSAILPRSPEGTYSHLTRFLAPAGRWR